MRNYDGSSCFMDSLMCALFFPVRLRTVYNCMYECTHDSEEQQSETGDAPVRSGSESTPKSSPESIPKSSPEPSLKSILKSVLRVVAEAVRGECPANLESYREALSRCVVHEALSRGIVERDYSQGQHDPSDLYESLLTALGVASVFEVVNVIERKDTLQKTTVEVRTDRMFRYSVLHALCNGICKLDNFFPLMDIINVAPSAGSDLLQKVSTQYYSSGDALCFTREICSDSGPALNYGEWCSENNGFFIRQFNVNTNRACTFYLQSVLCWSGTITGGTSGHYVCFLFHEPTRSWWFYNDAGDTFLPVQDIETHSHSFRPSTNGVMFFYALV